MPVAPASRGTATTGCPGRPEVCATGGYGLITVSSRSMQRVHAAGPSVPSSHGYDRGRAGRARPQSEVTGPVPVRDLEAKIIKCRTGCTVDSGHARMGPPRPPTFSIFGRRHPGRAPGASVGFEVHVEHHSHPQRGHAQQPWRSTGACTAAPHPRGRHGIEDDGVHPSVPCHADKPASSPRCQAHTQPRSCWCTCASQSVPRPR